MIPSAWPQPPRNSEPTEGSPCPSCAQPERKAISKGRMSLCLSLRVLGLKRPAKGGSNTAIASAGRPGQPYHWRGCLAVIRRIWSGRPCVRPTRTHGQDAPSQTATAGVTPTPTATSTVTATPNDSATPTESASRLTQAREYQITIRSDGVCAKLPLSAERRVIRVSSRPAANANVLRKADLRRQGPYEITAFDA